MTRESEGFPSGQREQTVNLPAQAFGGSNPPPSTITRRDRHAGIAQLVERQPSKLNVAGSNPVSRSNGGQALLAQSVERVLGKDEVSSSILEEGSSIEA